MPTLLLTGGSGEIGSAIAEQFRQKGYQVIAPSRQELDLNDPASMAHFMGDITVDIEALIHCAGFNQPKPAGELSRSDLEKTMQINSFAFYELVCHLLPHFKRRNQGHILGVSSLYGEFSRKNRLAYAASKHALNGMIKTLALELGAHNICVNGVAPGFVDTRMTRVNNDTATLESFKRKIPLGRLATAADIARVCYFLASNDNTYISGEIITVDGGYSKGGFQE
jgi:3-oxoacyl-[acyl-carrier protein] reductase